MNVYVTAISAIGLGDDGVIDCKVTTAIVRCLAGGEEELRNRLLDEARSRWSWMNGWKCHKVGELMILRREKILEILADIDGWE